MANTTTITASEFRQNFEKYMALVEVQDFQVTKNGTVVGVWSNPRRNKVALVEKLAGNIHAAIDPEADRVERRSHQ